MTKKIVTRKMKEHVKISDSVAAKVIRGVIIPAKFTNKSLKVNYFIPRFKKIVKGEDVRWVNQDSNNHHLRFYEVSGDKVRFLFDLGVIAHNKEVIKKFDFNILRIDYLCALHDNEVGTIIIYPKPEHEMTNAEQFRFLSKIFDITPPPILSHLRSK
jgi:plastocyanin